MRFVKSGIAVTALGLAASLIGATPASAAEVRQVSGAGSATAFFSGVADRPAAITLAQSNAKSAAESNLSANCRSTGGVPSVDPGVQYTAGFFGGSGANQFYSVGATVSGACTFA